MSYDTIPVLLRIVDRRLAEYKPTPEELREKIETAVLHCIEYKAKAIELAEKFNKEGQERP